MTAAQASKTVQRCALRARPKSVLIVTTVPATVNTFLTPYIEHFHRLSWRVEVATGPGELSERVLNAVRAVHEIPWTRSPTDLIQVAQSLRAIRRVATGGQYDIVHVHTPIAAGVTRMALATVGRDRRPAVVYTAHGFHFMPGQPWRRRIAPELVEWAAGKFTDRLVVINEADRQSATRLGLVKPDSLISMPGIGLDLEWYDPTPEMLTRSQAVRADMGLADDAVLLTMIAELFPRKGPQDALAALARMDDPRVHLAFAGTGPYRDDLVSMAHDFELIERVHFLSHVADVRPLILASRATTLPSYREGLSRSVLESLALCVPVIGSNIRGIADSVGHDGGILVPPGDVDALSAAFAAIVASTPYTHEERTALRTRLAQYSIESLIRRHEQLYDGLRATPRSHRTRALRM